jgi:methyl-accepting chemotaxis protein
MLKRLKIQHRIAAVILLMTLGLVAIMSVSLMELRDTLLKDRQTMVKQEVQTVIGMMDAYAERAKKGELSVEEAQAQVRDIVHKIRYGNGDYFFAYDETGTTRIQAGKPEMEGKNMIGLTDPDGVKLVERLIEAAKSGGGFVNYRFPRAGSDVPYPKVSYAAMAKDWGWMVGTGVYIDDVDTEFRHVAMQLGIIMGVVLVIGLGSAFVIARGITRPIRAVTERM